MRTAEAQKALFARCISTSSGQYANAGLGRAAEIRSQNGIWSSVVHQQSSNVPESLQSPGVQVEGSRSLLDNA